MAKLSDFQKPATPVAFVVDANVMDRNAKAAASRVNWRKTRITETGGAVESDPFRSFDKRARMHDALDRALDGAAEETEANEPVGEALGAAENMAEVMSQPVRVAAQGVGAALMESADAKGTDRRARMHAALDKLLDSMSRTPSQNEILAEPEALGQDDEPEEEDDDDESPESLDSAMDALHRRLRAILHASDSDTRPVRRVTVDRGAAAVISPHKIKLGHAAGYVTDSEFISRHLHPEMLCCDAERQFHAISLKRQADDPNRGYWSGLYYFLQSQPLGSKIKDIENKACLSSLLMRTVGGMKGAFGV